MDTVGHEQHIKSIIKLEERIGQCRRCPELIRCTSKPSLGKGDFEPEALLVFENDSKQTSNIKWIIELRNLIKKHFNIARVYHTYLMRCHPKSCISNHGNDCCLPSKLVNRNNICLLNQQLCDGIPIKPSNEEIINCMYFLLEEIEVLKPQYVILFGSRVEDFVLKSYGIFDSESNQQVYKYETTTILTTVEDNECKSDDIQRLARLIDMI